MADVSKKLERWLRQQIFRERTTPLEKFSLRAMKGQEVDTIEIPEGLTGDTISIYTDEIITRAQNDADALGTGLQRYLLVALELGAKNGPRFPFSLRGEGEDDDEQTDDGKPTEKGLVGQLMRHNEAMMRMLVMTTGQTNQVLARRLEQAEKTNESLITQRHEYLQLQEKLIGEQHDRDMQMMLTDGQEKRKDKLIEKLELLAPLIINKLAGKNVLPAGEGGDIFKNLADSLSPDQLQKIAPHLTGEQQLLLLTLIKAAREQGNASEKQSS